MSKKKKKQSILEKIKKLFALAKDNASEGERENAMRAANELLAKHNLELADIEGLAGLGDVVETRTNIGPEQWKIILARAAAELCFTKALCFERHKSGTGKLEQYAIFIGTAENGQVSIEFTNYLIDNLERESKRFFLGLDDFKVSFCTGAAARIFERAQRIVDEQRARELSEKQHVQEEPGQPGTSLVHVKKKLAQDAEDFIKNLDVKVAFQEDLEIDPHIFWCGQVYGEKVSLRKQIEGPVEEEKVEKPVTSAIERFFMRDAEIRAREKRREGSPWEVEFKTDPKEFARKNINGYE